MPHLGRDAQHLYVFQRTPSSVDERGNMPTDPRLGEIAAAGLAGGAQAQLPLAGHRSRVWCSTQPDLVCDFWTELGRNLTARIAAQRRSRLAERRADHGDPGRGRLQDHGAAAAPRRQPSSTTRDTAEALKPYYRFLCKRPCCSDEYLPTFNRPNVTLVDVSESKGVERLTEKGIVANGVEYEVDCVIFASGFEISTEISRRYAMDAIEGRDGLSLFDHWRDGYKTLHGITSRGFPNQFHTGFIQGGVSANTTAMFEQQAKHIAYIISEAHEARRDDRRAEPSRVKTTGSRPSGNSRSTIRRSKSPAPRAITTTKAVAAEKASARSSASSTRPASTRSTTC